MTPLTKQDCIALLDALSDNPENEEEEELLAANNPELYSAICKLREFPADK